MFCSKCGAEIDNTAIFCPNCKSEVSNQYAMAYAGELTRLKSISNIAALCSVFLPLIGFILGVYCLSAIRSIDKSVLSPHLLKIWKDTRTNGRGSILLSLIFSGVLGLFFISL